MVPATSPTLSPLARAFSRAVAEKIVVTHTADARVLAVASVAGGAWADRPYHVTVTGERPQDVACDCPAGRGPYLQARRGRHLQPQVSRHGGTARAGDLPGLRRRPERSLA
jgi:hypothetical protein